jgi:RimJ/RimL family protein N-acetyltransferase
MNLRLRDVEPSDLPLLFEHQRDPEGAAMAAFPSRDRPAFDAHWAKLLADDTCLKQAVLLDDEVVGNIGSWTSHGQREVGYWIDRAYWGRGIASAALSAFLRLEQTRPLFAGVAKHNAASIRILQKCGFTCVGPDEHDDSFLVFVLAPQTASHRSPHASIRSATTNDAAAPR